MYKYCKTFLGIQLKLSSGCAPGDSQKIYFSRTGETTAFTNED